MGFNEKGPVYVEPVEGKFEGVHKLHLVSKSGNRTKTFYTVPNIAEANKLLKFAEAVYERGRKDHAQEMRDLINE